jgi:hypothetical protein
VGSQEYGISCHSLKCGLGEQKPLQGRRYLFSRHRGSQEGDPDERSVVGGQLLPRIRESLGHYWKSQIQVHVSSVSEYCVVSYTTLLQKFLTWRKGCGLLLRMIDVTGSAAPRLRVLQWAQLGDLLANWAPRNSNPTPEFAAELLGL